ncbi:hypothetical protein [Bacillus sp. 2205SS5-2]
MAEHAVKPASRSGLPFDPSLKATAARFVRFCWKSTVKWWIKSKIR